MLGDTRLKKFFLLGSTSLKSVVSMDDVRSGEGTDITLLNPHNSLERLKNCPGLADMIITLPDEDRSLTYREFLVEQIEKFDNE